MFQFGELFIFLPLSPFSIQLELQGLVWCTLQWFLHALHVFSSSCKVIKNILLQLCRSIHLLFYWILFENVMSMHRTKATLIGLLEAGRANEWVVTEKLGDVLKKKAGEATKNKTGAKFFRIPKLRIGDRYTIIILFCYESI